MGSAKPMAGRAASPRRQRAETPKKGAVEEEEVVLDLGDEPDDELVAAEVLEFEEADEEDDGEWDVDGSELPPLEHVRTFTGAMERVARRRGQNLEAACAVPALLGVVAADGEAHVTLQAARALCGLINGHKANCSAAHAAGAVSVFVSLLTPRPEHPEPKAVSVLAARALSHLSADDPAQANYVRLGGAVAQLVDGPLARCADEPEAAAWAAAALAHIAAAGGASRDALASGERVVESLVRILDFAVPWVAGMDSPRRTSKPSAHHRRAACRAAEALASIMVSPEGASAVATIVSDVALRSPRLGTAISAASRDLLTRLQAAARQRLDETMHGSSQPAMKDALAFARGMLLPKSESGAARHFFIAARRRAIDMKKHPWRYTNADGTPGALQPYGTPSSPRRSSSPSTPRGSHVSPSTPRGASPTPRSPSKVDTRAAAPRPNPTKLGETGFKESAGPWTGAPWAAPAQLYPRGLADDPLPTGEYSLRSRSPAPGGGGGGGMASAVALAEQRMDAQLGGVRALLMDSIAVVQREHEAAVAALRSENRRLEQALAQSRAREVEYEDKLGRAVGAISGLAEWGEMRKPSPVRPSRVTR